jgi:hypothetical protein
MKKKLLATVMVAVVAAIAGYNVYQGQSDVQLSDIQLANVEALAQFIEQPDVNKCVYAPWVTCIALHPYDRSQDKERVGYMWLI